MFTLVHVSGDTFDFEEFVLNTKNIPMRSNVKNTRRMTKRVAEAFFFSTFWSLLFLLTSSAFLSLDILEIYF
jgi:hypothetical protein